MYLKSKMRLLGMSALVSVGLVAATSANAYNVRLGKVDIQVDTTVSAGVSVRVADRDTSLLPVSNGGPNSTLKTKKYDALGAGTNLVAVGSLSEMTTAQTEGCLENGSACDNDGPTKLTGGYAGSINTDDGRLNFDNGDITSGAVKGTVDIQANMGNWSAFTRVTGFYDGVLDNEESYERTGMTESGYSDSVRHIDLLDAYVDYESSFMGQSYLIRAGKQVINWGESTFILGGNSVFSPIDVAAIQRPGAEIKEALLPVEAIYGSISLPYDLSVEAYVGGHDPFKFPAAGTSLSGVDGFFNGGIGGSFIGGNANSGNGRINCDRAGTDAGVNASSAYTQALGNASEAALAAVGYGDCSNSDFRDFRYHLGSTAGITAEEERIAGNDNYFLPRDTSLDTGSDFDSMGLAVRWYAESLNSTEFGFYYQDYQSRIPYVSIMAEGPQAGVGVIGAGAGSNDRLSPMRTQCGAALAGKAASTISTVDTFGMLDETKTFGAVLDGLHGSGGTGTTLADINAGALVALDTDLDGYISAKNTYGRLFELACYSALSAASSNKMDDGTGALVDVVDTGEMIVGVGWGNSRLVAEYPDIEVWGISAATTLFGWGVQGEVTYRPDMPLQIDTDAVTISTLVANCGFDGYGGYLTTGGFTSYAEYNSRKGLVCGDTGLISGFHNEDVYNWDIGTTATFTRSNPVISLLGADLGILLTEFAGVYVDEIDDATGRFDEGSGIVTTNMCTSGSDLGLKSVFSLDPRVAGECRATRSSYGGVLLGRLQYNNVLGTPLSVSPTLVVQHGIEGRSPSPAATWKEGIGRAGLSLDVDYQGKWTGSLGYTDYYGDSKFSRDGDRDFVSLSLKRGF
jgi:hypothetical protein